MKKTIILLSLVAAVAFPGCNYLEMDPEQLNTIDKVFSSRDETRKWYNSTFSSTYFPTELHDAHYYNHFIFGVDDAACLQAGHLNAVVLGQINPGRTASGTDRYWFTIFYEGIRHCNIFLENVDKCKELGEDEALRMKAEVRFMRVMMHYWILRDYGPIPIMDQLVQTESVGTMLKARNSMDECVKWMIDEIDDLWPDLESKARQAETRYGFPTQGAALAIKARILLLDASPMYNGNTVYANWKNNDGKQLISQTYDNEKWRKAAEAAKEVIDMASYELLKPDTGADFDDYVTVCRMRTTTWNDELIWGRPNGQYWWNMSSWPAVLYSWNGRNSVTLEMINSYFMADGSVAKPMEQWFSPREFSTADGDGTQANTFMMFVGREPRFYADNFFPNQVIDYSSPNYPNTKQVVEYWYAGNSGGSKTPGDKNSTGFSPQKHISLDSYSDQRDNTANYPTIPFPVVRLAEVYLNYCEALNEYEGAASHSKILPYLNELRERAGVSGYSGPYSKEEMRELIRQERRVELVWEGHRYFDVRRWFIAHGEDGVFNKPVHGLNMTRGQNATDPDFFTIKEVQPRYFRMEHYMMPINSTEVAFNTDLAQAPFYD